MITLASLFVVAFLAAASPAPDASLARESVESLALRERYKVPAPRGEATIYVRSVAAHHIRSEFSTIAWRDASGAWSVSRMGEDGPGGLLPIETRLLPEEVRKLSAEEGRALDLLLAETALYDETPAEGRRPGIGTPFHVMEIVVGDRRAVFRWYGRLEARAGKVADLVFSAP